MALKPAVMILGNALTASFCKTAVQLPEVDTLPALSFSMCSNQAAEFTVRGRHIGQHTSRPNVRQDKAQLKQNMICCLKCYCHSWAILQVTATNTLTSRAAFVLLTHKCFFHHKNEPSI